MRLHWRCQGSPRDHPETAAFWLAAGQRGAERADGQLYDVRGRHVYGFHLHAHPDLPSLPPVSVGLLQKQKALALVYGHQTPVRPAVRVVILRFENHAAPEPWSRPTFTTGRAAWRGYDGPPTPAAGQHDVQWWRARTSRPQMLDKIMSARDDARCPMFWNRRYLLLLYWNTSTFKHWADTFIQSDFQCLNFVNIIHKYCCV